MRIIFKLFTLILIITSCEDRVKENNAFADFPTSEMLIFLERDISNQLSCSCISFKYDEQLTDEQEDLMFFGTWANDVFKVDSINLLEKRYDFIAPPDEWLLHNAGNNSCETILIPRVVFSKDKTLFFTRLRVLNNDKRYVFLILRDKSGVWEKKLTGAFLDYTQST